MVPRRQGIPLRLTVAGLLVLAASVLIGGCGGGAVTGTDMPGSTAAASQPIVRQDPDGVVAGLVFEEPVSLSEALALGTKLGGDPIAVYRTDDAYVLPINLSAQPVDTELVASRFAYVDAEGIRERRTAAIQAGDAPPITGLHTSQTYWEHWEDQWRLAQEPGVLFEAVAIYVRQTTLEALEGDARFSTVVVVPHRRTDSESADYLGELLLESEDFPSGT